MATTRHDRAAGALLADHKARLQRASQALAVSAEEARLARSLRDAAIRDAVAAGLSLRQIGGALGLSPQGVATAAAQGQPIYNTIGRSYSRTRQPDPRIRDAIWAALGGARSVVNVGAGAGSYEPPQTLLAVEPSLVMVAQRPEGLAPAAVTTAERIPLPDDSVDAALCVLTVHHWPDVAAGFREIRRVARSAVVFTWDFEVSRRFWLCDYIPAINELDARIALPIPDLCSLLGTDDVRPVMVPHDCADGFLGAFWRRPEAYLDPEVRAGISSLARLDQSVANAGLELLVEDLRSGAWQRRYQALLERDEFDAGYRLVVARWDR
ncbi:MAG: class I SAM-dependent methyltransferase [Dehalococcoidia bacterium]|nr:class I SAM-dependent methyltransferase [Dehalococcoidia bacterium]